MGKMSDLMIENENERAEIWIRERLENNGADEESEEYKELADEYYSLQEYLMEQDELEEELEWLKDNESSLIHKHFLEELDELKKLTDASESFNKKYIIYRMTYAHAVTLLEAFLGDTAKSLVSENSSFFQNARQIEELKKARYSLEYLATNEVDAKGLAIKELSNILYHNIPKVKSMFEKILNSRFEIDISEIVKITKTRHDIVHRNGKTKDGEPIYLSQFAMLEMISHIRIFANNLQAFINKKT